MEQISMSELVSVIIPVYNTAKYLDASLESVVNQTYQNLQIILVDDGATDESPVMCDAWANRDSRIMVIHKENEGLGFTRNAGLNVAKGTFVCFLDSDDTIAPDTFEYCVKELSSRRADACYYGRRTQQRDGSVTVNSDIPKKLEYKNEEVRNEFAAIYFGRLPEENSNLYIQASACCVMYRRSVIEQNGLRFLSERQCLSEDTFFNLDFCKYAQKVLIIPKDFYFYTFNSGSLTKKYNPDRIIKSKAYCELLLSYAEDFTGVEQINIRVAYQFYVYLRHAIEYEIKSYKINGIWQTYKKIYSICKDSFVRENLSKIPMERLGTKRKIFVWCMVYRQIWFLFLYYAFIK